MRLFKIAMFTFLSLVLFTQTTLAANKHQERFCKIEPYVTSDYVYVPITSINYAFKAAHASLAVMYQIEKDTTFLRRMFHKDWPSAKTALQYAGKISYFKVAARTLIPFMDKTSKAVRKGKINFTGLKGQTVTIRGTTEFDKFYKSFLNAKLAWSTFSKLYGALSLATLGTCKSIKVFYVDICLKKKQQCGADFLDSDAILVGSDGKAVASANTTQCSLDDNQKASKFVSLSNQYSSDADAMYAMFKAVGPELKKAKSPSAKLSSVLRSMHSSLKSMQKTVTALKKGMAPIQFIGRKIKAVLNQQVCVSYLVPGIKKKCTKKKILGKKTRFCVNKPTMTKKKHCTKVEKVIKSINKLAKPIQKPMDAAIKKLTNPIIKPVLKKLPGFDASKLLRAVQQLKNYLGVLAKVSAIAKKYSPSRMKSYQGRYATFQRELNNLNR